MNVFSVVCRAITRIYQKLNASIFSRGSSFTVANSAERDGMEIIPFYPPNVLDGNPVMRAKALCKSGDDGFMTGLWDCSAGRFIWHFDCDEVVHILEGEVIVEVDGKVERLVKGSVGFFPIGTVSTWDVPHYVFKVFSHRNPTPTLKKIFNR